VAALLKVDPRDNVAMLGAGLVANALVNLELIARSFAKKES
jgi:hypothetical protein